MEPSQILGGLFQDAGRQIALARFSQVIFSSIQVISGSIHLVDLFVQCFLKVSNADISENLRFLRDSLGRGRSLVLPVNVWPASLDRRGRIETEQ